MVLYCKPIIQTIRLSVFAASVICSQDGTSKLLLMKKDKLNLRPLSVQKVKLSSFYNNFLAHEFTETVSNKLGSPSLTSFQCYQVLETNSHF